MKNIKGQLFTAESQEDLGTRLNEFLEKHPNIEIVAMSQSESRSILLGTDMSIKIHLTLFYREGQ